MYHTSNFGINQCAIHSSISLPFDTSLESAVSNRYFLYEDTFLVFKGFMDRLALLRIAVSAID